MGILEGLDLSFSESMEGYLAEGQSDPVEGEARGRARGQRVHFEVTIEIEDLEPFLRVSQHDARLTGAITCEMDHLRGTFPITDGAFTLFSVALGQGRLMIYRFNFADAGGQQYHLHGEKHVHDDMLSVDLLQDITTLFTTVHKGSDRDAPVFAAGKLVFHMKHAPRMAASARVKNTTCWFRKATAVAGFLDFCYSVLREQYYPSIQPMFHAGYQNLVLSGELAAEDGPRRFFLVSGPHEPGIPWGDGQTFADVLLAVEDGDAYQRYCISGRALDGLRLDAVRGTWRYHGPIFRITEGSAARTSEMERGDPRLARCTAALDLTFTSTPLPAVTFPLPGMPRPWGLLPRSLREALTTESPFGFTVSPNTATQVAGTLRIQDGDQERALEVITDRTFGEAEQGRMFNFKSPRLRYNMLWGLRPDRQAARIQLHSQALRDRKQHWVVDRAHALIGSLLERWASGEILIEGSRQSVRRFGCGRRAEPKPLQPLDEPPVLEVINDQYPTAEFLRRIVRVKDPDGEQCLAMEERVETMRLEPVGSDRKVRVASIYNPDDRRAALDEAMERAGFWEAVDAAWSAGGKEKEEFLVVVKPNFMFAYNVRDRSTYTDPALIKHLARRLRERGYINLRVVEAQSTYGQYFDRRGVREMARYLGFESPDLYEVVDLTETASGSVRMGQHLGQMPISPAWRDADFRISFAKNKSHTFTFYTLTLKNIYGALPMADKFKEYHCKRDIFHTTVEFLERFPVHFGFIDAYLSADGPFGIFARTDPRQTHTVLAGEDLVAVDWVGASKMGIDPRISEYMQLALEAFGKPAIDLVGDASPYRPWLNVPAQLTEFSARDVDHHYFFGNVLFMAGVQMDEEHFQSKETRTWERAVRALMYPVRRTFFVWTDRPISPLGWLTNWLFYRMGY